MSEDQVCTFLYKYHMFLCPEIPLEYLVVSFEEGFGTYSLSLPSFPDGFTPLMIASCSGGGLETGNSEEEEDPSAEIISDFICQGANLHNQTDRTGETALHLAARYARSDAAKRLLESSADANVQDNMGRTPLHAAVAADAQGVFQVTCLSFGLLALSRCFIFKQKLNCFLADSNPKPCH